jgi:hypothetical protein
MAIPGALQLDPEESGLDVTPNSGKKVAIPERSPGPEERFGTLAFVDTGASRGRVKADTIALEIEHAIMARKHAHGDVVKRRISPMR